MSRTVSGLSQETALKTFPCVTKQNKLNSFVLSLLSGYLTTVNLK